MINYLSRLLYHERHRRVRFYSNFHHYKVDGKTLRGLTTCIQSVFVPRGAQQASYSQSKATQCHPKCIGFGAEHGKVVDYELQQYVDKKATADTVRDPCTRIIIQYLEKEGWRPVCTQMLLFDEILGYATAIDLLCKAKDGTIVVVEIKTTRHLPTYNRVIEEMPFRGCLKFQGYSAYVHHQLQAYVPTLTLEKRYGVKNAQAVVFVISPMVRKGSGRRQVSTRLDMLPTPVWMETNRDLIYQHMARFYLRGK